ncbi:MAG: HEAT repeat domain-containing protein [Myxococcales bacterium]|nr:HEAT repeat domain-containing protein [Myxococcales bacterium]
MGLFSFLGGNSDKKNTKNISKAVQRLRSPAGQTQERLRMVELLTEIGTPEAVSGLLVRFTMRTPGSIVDEDEKQTTYNSLLRLGDVCVEPLKTFIKTDANIYWPLRALTEIAGVDVAVETLLESLQSAEHGFAADMERREQLVSNLREYHSSDRAFQKLVELTTDESDEVRILAIDGLTEFDRPEVPRVLATCLCVPDQSQRVRSTVLDILVDREIDMSVFRDEIRPWVSGDYVLDNAGRVRRSFDASQSDDG